MKHYFKCTRATVQYTANFAHMLFTKTGNSFIGKYFKHPSISQPDWWHSSITFILFALNSTVNTVFNDHGQCTMEQNHFMFRVWISTNTKRSIKSQSGRIIRIAGVLTAIIYTQTDRMAYRGTSLLGGETTSSCVSGWPPTEVAGVTQDNSSMVGCCGNQTAITLHSLSTNYMEHPDTLYMVNEITTIDSRMTLVQLAAC